MTKEGFCSHRDLGEIYDFHTLKDFLKAWKINELRSNTVLKHIAAWGQRGKRAIILRLSLLKTLIHYGFFTLTLIFFNIALKYSLSWLLNFSASLKCCALGDHLIHLTIVLAMTKSQFKKKEKKKLKEGLSKSKR